jgi:hypothetical protein
MTWSRKDIVNILMRAQVIIVLLLPLVLVSRVIAEESPKEEAKAGQDAETKALDSTATQWSFQLAYQTMPDYH